MRRNHLYLLTALLMTALLIVAATAWVALNIFSSTVAGPQEVGINSVVAMAKKGEVDTIEVNGDDLTIVTTSGETLISEKEAGSSITEILQSGGVDLRTSKIVLR